MNVKEELVKICHKVYANGFVAANDGNLSIRIDENKILITRSGINKGSVTENDILTIVKPNDQGSAIGLSICENIEELEEGIANAFQFSNNILIENYIAGYEVTVGIIDKHVLPVLEIKLKHSYYDYECKYTAGMSEYEVPAKFPDEIYKLLQTQSLLAYNSVGCKNYGRVDFRLDKDYKPYCLEINTLPGLTSTSLLPKAAKADGIGFENLIDRIIKISLNRL